MNRTEYRKARALFRANGQHAFRWMPADHAAILADLMLQQSDQLAQRARWKGDATLLVMRLCPLHPVARGTMAPVRIPEHRQQWNAFHDGEWVADYR